MCKIALLGGAGYIGSHVFVELIRKGFEVIIIDNLHNSSIEMLKNLENIVEKKVVYHIYDIRNEEIITKILIDEQINFVVHCAALKSITESIDNPFFYYDVNVGGTISILKAMRAAKVKNLIFSSSAAVYGIPEQCPIQEGHPLHPTNPYSQTKAMCEKIIAYFGESLTNFRYINLRYFNPVGMHRSGYLKTYNKNKFENLMPLVCCVAAGLLPYLRVFGNDYHTRDGTGVRDYIHITDLARAHVDAIVYLMNSNVSVTVNLGTGQGYTVKEIINTFETSTGRNVPYMITDRRPGDVAECYADPSLAHVLLGWKTEFSLSEMCVDTWRSYSRSLDDR